MTSTAKILIAVTLAAAVAAGLYLAHQTSVLHNQAQMLQQQQMPLTERIQELQRERDGATGQIAALRGENERLNRNAAELLKLRGEVGMLKRQLAEAPRSKAQTEAQTTASQPNDALEQQKRMAGAKSMDAHLYLSAFLNYAEKNQWQLPTNWTQLYSFMPNNPDGTPSGTNSFEMVYQGPVNWNDLGQICRGPF